MNALVPQNNRTALANAAAYDPFASAGEDMGGSNAKYLKFNGNSGEYTFGAEAEELEKGTRLVVNMAGFRRGWICWKDEQVAEEIMVRVVEGPPPPQSQLTDHGPYVVTENKKEGWTEQSAVDFRDPTTGDEYTFKVSSKSALRALGTLMKDYAKVYKSKPGMLPIIELDVSSWMPKVKAHGKKYSPVLKIVDWANENDLLAQHGDSPEGYEDEEGAEEGEVETNEVETQPEPAPAPKPTAATTKPAAAPAAAGAPRRRAF